MARRAAASNLFAIVVAAVAWPALMLQYWLILWMLPTWVATLRFLSFFTILSNLLVALVATAAAIGGDWRVFRWLRSARVRGLAALSITVTWLVYMTVLQSGWNPQGPQLIADRALHDVVPLLYVFWWLALQEHGALAWRDVARWLLFPGLYGAWALLYGKLMDDYPYWFLEVSQIGYRQVLLNAALIGLVFVALGLLYVAIDRRLGRRYMPET